MTARIRLMTVIPLLMILGCSSRDHRLTRMAEQQAQLNQEMVRLNRDVVRGMTRLTPENAEFRKEALAVQKQLHDQRGDLIQKQDAGRDWYEGGAEELLARQGRTGGWGRLEETCFAILFLRKVTFSAPTERKVGKVTEKEDPPKRPAPDASLPFLRDWLLAGPFPAKTKIRCSKRSTFRPRR